MRHFFLQGELFSVISQNRLGDVLLQTAYVRKGEKHDERVDLLQDRICKNFDWIKTEWEVLEPEVSEMEEVDVQAEPDGSVDDTDVAAEVDTPATNVAGRGKRKIHDEATVSGICSKKITLDPETKNFIQGLIHTSVISLGDRLSTQLEKMEAGFVERMGKMESQVSQLREAFTLSGEASDPSKVEQAPHKRKADQAPAKKKVDQAPAKKNLLPTRKCRT